MTSLVAGWVGSVAILFIAIAQPWRSAAARAPLPLLLAVGFAAWSLWDGSVVYRDLIAQGAWTAAAIVIPYVAVKALMFAVLAYAVGRTALTARTSTAPRRHFLPASLAVVLVVALGADLRASFQATQIRTARSETLTPEQVTAIVKRIADGSARDGEITAFMQNPLCPPELLQQYAAKTPSLRVYIARNPRAPADLLLTLSQDKDPEVRYSTVYNSNLPASELPRMAEDTNAIVRETVVWKRELPEDVFVHLLADTEPRVRAAAALQPRISDAALLLLTSDSDPNVRGNATRIAVQRGLKE